MPHQLLGISGLARSGKDTFANYLVRKHGFIRNAFADPLKQAAQSMFFLTDAQTWQEEFKDEVIPHWNMAPRKMFQLLGTEGGRELFGQDLWLKRWQFHYQQFAPHTDYVTPDVRFDNEADLIRGLGGRVIHLEGRRGGKGLTREAQAHASEGGILYDTRDIVVQNDGSFEDFYKHIDNLMEALRHGE